MNSKYKAAVVAIMVIILLVNPVLFAAGNPPPGRWEKVAETKTGAGISVYTKDGGKQKYKFQSIDDQFLNCANRNNNSIQIEVTSIDKVTLEKRGKYTGISALLGLGGGAAIGGMMGSRDRDSEGDILGIIYMSAIGLLAGALTGAAMGSPETIYISKEAALEKAARK
jgi:hypothetical protein